MFALPLVKAAANSQVQCDQSFENFESGTPGSFPKDFLSHDNSKLQKHVAAKNYYLLKEENGNVFLNATAIQMGLIVHKNVNSWNLDVNPVLRWKWRIKQYPTNANELALRTNDVAASVYVIWKASAFMRVKSIKFTWSSSQEVGTHVSRRFGLDHVHVLRNPKTPHGDWVEETVDVREMFKKYYRAEVEELESPIAVGFLTDSDATNSSAEADYDDISLCHYEDSKKPSPASVQLPNRK